ncbi:MAG: hypothetical protein ACJ79U_19220 [Myxococcales bacterium]
MTGRVLSLAVAIALVPAMARSATPAEPAEPAEVAAPAQQTPPSGAGTNTGSVTIPPKLQERTDFQLTLTTLEALRKKGTMSEEDYNAALRDLITVGQRASTAPTFVVGRFVTTLYGYLEGDIIHDTQRVTTDGYGGSPSLNLSNVYNGQDGRTVFSARGTRLGIRFAAPELGGIRVRGNFEMDFVGNQPGAPPNGSTAPSITEAAFFDNPTPRIRIALVQADTDYVTLSVGQTWNVMAFAAAYLPTSVQPQGLPGQLFARNPQLRVSHLFDAKAFSFDVAVAALRPPQFNSEVPDLQAGIKFNINDWTGVQSIGSTATTISPASIAVTGAHRMIKMATVVGGTPTPTFATATDTVNGNVIALNAFVPVLAAKQRGPFAVSLIGEATTGTGMGDLFTGLNGGMNAGQPPTVPPANYAPFRDIDNGIAGFTVGPQGHLDTLDFRTLLVGAQFSYGKVVLAGNYSNVYSDNVRSFTGANWNHQMWWDANLIVDPWAGVRFGLEFARTVQNKVTGPVATNNRVFFGSFFIF